MSLSSLDVDLITNFKQFNTSVKLPLHLSGVTQMGRADFLAALPCDLDCGSSFDVKATRKDARRAPEAVPSGRCHREQSLYHNFHRPMMPTKQTGIREPGGQPRRLSNSGWGDPLTIAWPTVARAASLRRSLATPSGRKCSVARQIAVEFSERGRLDRHCFLHSL
jgi:hypothetical protein